MQHDEAVPEGVGPHEGRELERMLAGRKPLAMFVDELGSEDEEVQAGFAPFVADGTLIRREFVYRPAGQGPAARFIYFARPGEEWRIEAIHRINEKLFVHGEATYPEIEREIGRLLGYADTDINQYLEWLATMNASHQ